METNDKVESLKSHLKDAIRQLEQYPDEAGIAMAFSTLSHGVKLAKLKERRKKSQQMEHKLHLRSEKEELRIKLIKLYKQGNKTHREIALECGIRYQNVYTFWQNKNELYGLPKPARDNEECTNRRKGKLAEKVEEAYSLYKSGLNLEQVGQRYGGVSRERVRQIFRKNGLSSRTPGIARRKHFICENGHQLGLGESRNNCKTCIIERKEFRKKGLHLKTHCIHGHALVGHNIIWETNGHKKWLVRRCRTCQTISNKKSVEKRKNAHNA